VSEESSQTRAAALLREYLATRDIPCEACGYNLRGAQDVFCPECGGVIPRPPAEHVTRSLSNPAELKLRCRDCGYAVTGVNVERCPECGGRSMARYTGKKPPARFRVPWLPRNLPLLLTAGAIIGAMMVVMAVSLAAQLWASPRGSGGAAGALTAAIFFAGPLAIAWLWLRYWPRLRLIDHGPRRLISTAGFVLGLGLVAIGIRLL
jgi:hypothetical protein